MKGVLDLKLETHAGRLARLLGSVGIMGRFPRHECHQHKFKQRMEKGQA